MSFDIRLVDTWGKDVGLSTSNGFLARVCNSSPTFDDLLKQNKITGNDGNNVTLRDICDVQGALLVDALNATDAGNKDVAQYLRRLVTVARKYGRDSSMALTFL